MPGLSPRRISRTCMCGLFLCLLPAGAVVRGEEAAQAQTASHASPERTTKNAILGTWQATLQADRAFRFVLKVEPQEGTSPSALLYNIDRNGQPHAATEFFVLGEHVELAFASIGARFEGRLGNKGDVIDGNWKQDGAAKSLVFQRATEATAWEIPALPPRRKAPTGVSLGYEVATVKLANPEAMGSGLRVRGRRLEAINMSVSELLQFAYELQSRQVLNRPEWADKEKFDLEMLYAGEDYPSDPECKAMVRQVLAEHFGLKVHPDRKDLPVYALTVADSGTRLTQSKGDPNGLPGLGFRAPGVLSAQNATMVDLAQALQRSVLDRPILDQTGLSGRWDFGLQWTPDSFQFPDRPRDTLVDTSKPDLFTAIQQQLGLKLMATRAPAVTLTIDHVEKPSEN